MPSIFYTIKGDHVSAVVFLGGTIGLAIKLLPSSELKKVEYFSPTTFFLVLLPPIIFESGYNLHKGKENLELTKVSVLIENVIFKVTVINNC